MQIVSIPALESAAFSCTHPVSNVCFLCPTPTLLPSDFLAGQLVDFVKRVEQKGSISCDTVLKIFYQSCRAVQHMHKQKPPVIHRDLKVTPPLTQTCAFAAIIAKCLHIL